VQLGIVVLSRTSRVTVKGILCRKSLRPVPAAPALSTGARCSGAAGFRSASTWYGHVTTVLDRKRPRETLNGLANRFRSGPSGPTAVGGR
jgi:hypothetical protein